MKKIKLNFVFLLVVGLLLATAPVQNVNAQASVSFQFFYDELSPYGNWVSYPQYGYVWVPAAGPGFRPYLSNGHWVFTDNGWMWASNYDWGWAPFHYGSWVMDPAFGWIWVPGYDWAPAWVTWGNYNGYYGWAPVQPGFSFSVNTYHPPIDYWCFMHPRYMTTAHYGNHFYVAHNRRIALGSNAVEINNVTNITVVNNVTRVNNTTFNAGPRRVDFENSAKVKVQQVTIRESVKPGRMREEGSAVSVYRPRVAKANAASEKPRKISSSEDARRNNTEWNKTNLQKDKVPVNRAQPIQQNEKKNQLQKVNGASDGSRQGANPGKQIVSPKQQVRPNENEGPKVKPGIKPTAPVSGERLQPATAPPREQRKDLNTQPAKPAPVQQGMQERRQPQNQMNVRSNRRQPEQPRQEPTPRTNQPRRK